MTEPHRPSQLDAIAVEYKESGRVVTCFCGEKVSRSIVPHLKTKHQDLWKNWVETFIKLRSLGYPLKKIMRLFKAGDGKLLFSWTVIERAIRQEVESGIVSYSPPPKLTVREWQPSRFILETRTVWDFPRRGDWAVHSGDYRGNWPPQIPRNLIERYTQVGDLVVDAFMGGGTTLIEAWLLRRRSIGLDISKLALQTTNSKLKEMEELAKKDGLIHLDSDYRPKVLEENALELSAALRKQDIQPGAAKLVCAHPPYLNSLGYTTNNSCDLSLIGDVNEFCKRMRLFAHEARQVLTKTGICAVLIGDVRKTGKTIPLGFKTLETFLGEGFELDNIVVKTQHKDRSSEFYMSRDNNGILLLAHEYLFILSNQ